MIACSFRVGPGLEEASWTVVLTHISLEKPPHAAHTPTYLRQLDSSLLEGAGAGVVSADVAVLAPVAPVRALHAGQTPGEGDKEWSLGQPSPFSQQDRPQKYFLKGKIAQQRLL